MKKGLLLLAAAAVAVSSSAQLKTFAAKKSKVADTKVAPFVVSEVKAQMATAEQRKAAKKNVAPKAAVKAWYNRPAGAFYRSLTSEGAAFYSPAVMLPSWREITWPNASEGATAYSWEYQRYNTEIKDWETATSTDENLTEEFIWSSMTAPSLTATGAGASDTYQLFSNYTNDDTKEVTPYEGYTYYCPDPRAEFDDSNLDCYLSPKLWTAGAREKVPAFADFGGNITLTGATPAAGEETGYWFGKNGAGWNAMALYVEKPAYAYALRGLHVFYRCESVTGETPVYAKVYAATKNAAGELILGDVLYNAKGVLSSDSPTRGFIDMSFVEEEDGLEYEVVASIDQEIAIVFYGYENAAAKGFNMCISTDCVDEGYGQHGYMVHVDAEGNPEKMYGLEDFFTISLGLTAPSIFLDVEWPMMMWNYTFETGEYNFPAEGGKLVENYLTYEFDYISVYSTKSCEEWTVLTTDDEDVPEWLTLELADVVDETGAFDNEVQIQATAAPLPEGVQYRECDVKFAVPGASVVYHFTQGEKPSVLPGDINEDGVVNVSDATALVNHILGEAEYDPQVCDVDGNGVINVSDVTALINLILAGE